MSDDFEGRWILMKTATALSIMFFTAFVSGCSALWEEISFTPAESGGWNVEGVSSHNMAIDNVAFIAQHTCGGLEISVQRFGLVKNSFWGPPIFPIIPKFEEQTALLTIEIEGGDEWGICPEIGINKIGVSGGMRKENVPWQKPKIICEYLIRAEGDFSLEFTNIDGSEVCPKGSLKFRESSKWKYRPFVMPRT